MGLIVTRSVSEETTHFLARASVTTHRSTACGRTRRSVQSRQRPLEPPIVLRSQNPEAISRLARSNTPNVWVCTGFAGTHRFQRFATDLRGTRGRKTADRHAGQQRQFRQDRFSHGSRKRKRRQPTCACPEQRVLYKTGSWLRFNSKRLTVQGTLSSGQCFWERQSPSRAASVHLGNGTENPPDCLVGGGW
jgi:hypothetical protein